MGYQRIQIGDRRILQVCESPNARVGGALFVNISVADAVEVSGEREKFRAGLSDVRCRQILDNRCHVGKRVNRQLIKPVVRAKEGDHPIRYGMRLHGIAADCEGRIAGPVNRAGGRRNGRAR